MFMKRTNAVIFMIVFAIISLISLYRLIFWFPITIGGYMVGQTMSFLSFVIFGSLALIAAKDLKRGD